MAFALRRLSNEERADHVERLLTAGVEMLEAGGIHAVNLDAVRAQLTPGKIEASLGAQRYLATR